MSGTEGAWLQSLESSKSCLVLDHSSLSRWETSSWAEGPAHWVAPCNKSYTIYENLKLSRISFTVNLLNRSIKLIESIIGWQSNHGLLHAIWLLLKPPSWKLHQLDHFNEIRIYHGPTLPVGGECLRPDQRQELSRDLLAVSVREEEEEEKREEDHPHHLEMKSRVIYVES